MISIKLVTVITITVLCHYGDGTSLFPEDLSVLKDRKDLSPDCLEQISNLDSESLLTMFDASTKIPNGLLAGSFFDFGNFDECLNIDAQSAVGPIRGKFCLGTIHADTELESPLFNINRTRPTNILDPMPRMLGTDINLIGWHFSICVPHKCTAKEISTIITYKERFCYSKNDDVKFTAGFITTTVIIGLFLLVVVASTIYDVVLEQIGRKSRHDILVAFSALSNGRKLFSSSKNPDQLLCLNGIKAISMMWVILGHVYSFALMGPVVNVPDILKFQEATETMFIINATVSVDTFFVVGGLVTVYTFLRAVDKKIKFNIFLYYLHRYLRLTPAFAIIILIHVNILRYLGSGPLWGTILSDLEDPCRSGWWSSVLYVQNFHTLIADQITCVPQSWYLSVDMQLFVLSPLILLPLVRWPTYTLYGLGSLVIAGVAAPLAIGYVTGIDAMLGTGDSQKFMKEYYIQTYARFGPYVIGMIIGYCIYKLKKGEIKLKLGRIVVYALWLVAIGGMLACLYAPHESDHTRLSNAFMLGYQRSAWAVALSAVILLCVAGYGGPIDWILSRPVFQLLTKLSYSMYLVHYLVIGVKTASLKTTVTFSNTNAMMEFWGYFMYTFALSIVLCLTFESPIIIIEKMLLGREEKPRTKKNVQGPE